MSLAEKHPHERDERLAFDGPSHTYVVDGLYECRSVTKAVAMAFPEFNADRAIKLMRGGLKWHPEHPMYGKTDEEIKKIWSEKGKVASAAGTEMHRLIEESLNSSPMIVKASATHPELHLGFAPFMEHISNTYPELVPFRTEWAIFDKKNCLAGTVDAVFYNPPKNSYFIFDWKRTESIEYDNQWGESARGNLAHLPDSKGARYALQLNLYAYMLETFYDMKIEKMFVVAMHPDMPGTDKFQLMPVPLLQDEAKVLATRSL